MRNLLEELRFQQAPSILGVRTHIYTGRWVLLVSLLDRLYSLIKYINCHVLRLSVSFYRNCTVSCFQCFIHCLVHVKSGGSLGYSWSASSGKSSEVYKN
jgi:hypothetical protein